MQKLSFLMKNVPRLLAALLLFGAGILFFAFSEALKVLGIAIGALLMLFSVVYAILALRSEGIRYRYIRLFFSLLGIISGAVTMVLRDGALSVIVTVAGILLIVNGSFNLQKELIRRDGCGFFFWLFATLATLTILGGFVLIRFFPDPTSPFAGVLLGVVFIIDALSNLFSPPLRTPQPSRIRWNTKHPPPPSRMRSNAMQTQLRLKYTSANLYKT